MHIIRVLLTVAWFTLAAMPAAHADPISAAIIGFVLPGLAGTGLAIATSLVTFALTAAASYVVGLLSKAKEPAQKQPGFELQVQIGDNTPVSFPAGFSGIAGSRKYVGTWGKDGDTPNAYLTDVIQVSDRPSQNLNKFWALKKPATILWDEPPAEAGYPVAEFRVEGKDHMWVQWYNGSQTTASPYLMAKFGAKEWRPWTSEFIGWGCAYAVVTTLVNRDLFQGVPDFMFEPSSSRFYDLRKDSTNGGSGSHRWNDENTWEPSSNPVVIIYNVIRGVYYGNQWIYGGQNLPAFRLPPSSWMAAANECDVAIPLAAGGTQPQYRCGTEVRGDIEPLTLIQTLLTGCNGRIAEVGGRFEILVGAPGSAVFSFTDDDIIITKGQSLTPFPSLQETHNGIEASFPSSADMWQSKDAPPRYSASLEAEDGRRLITSVTFPTVPFGVQVQRLMKTMLQEERRFRVHVLALGPEAWALTPNSVISWTSARNGYSNKKFLIVRKTGEPGFNQVLVLKEIDPADYSWSTSDEIDEQAGANNPEIIPPQVVKGFYVEPSYIDGANGTKQAAIDVHWDGTQPDVRTIMIRIRLDDGDIPVFQGRPVDFAAGVARIPTGSTVPTRYEVQVEYEPYSARPTELSEWLPVTTFDARLSAFDLYEGVIGFPYLGQDMQNYIDSMAQVRDIIDAMSRSILRTIDQDAGQYLQIDETRREIKVSAGNLTAYFQESILVAVGPDSAIAQQLVELGVEMEGKASASALTALQSTVTDIDGQVEANTFALTQIDAKVDDAVATASTGLQTQITQNKNGITAVANDVTDLFVSMGGGSAGTRARFTAYGTPSGFSARIGLEASATNGGTFRSAGLFIDVPSSGPTRVAIDANQFVVMNGVAGAVTPFIVQGGVVYMDTARIRDLTVDTIKIMGGAITSAVQTTPAGSVQPTRGGTGAFLQGGTLAIPSGGNLTGVSIDVNAVFTKTALTTDSGLWTIVILRAGSEIGRMPNLEFSYLDQGVAHYMFFDTNPVAGNIYYSARALAIGGAGPADFLVKGASMRLQLAKR